MATKKSSPSKASKGDTFLLRLTPDIRQELDTFRTQSQAKSLQALIMQFIGEGLKKDDFSPAQLFSKDLHARQLSMSVGQGADLMTGGFRIPLEQREPRGRPINIHALTGAHERVLEELDNQKLTSFAALMDPALMSYRLLLDFCLQDPSRRDVDSLIRDFSNGLGFSASQAMTRRKWNFAQILLLQACDLDPENTELGFESGVYLIRRLMRRWVRTKLSHGVTSQTLITGFTVSSGNQAGGAGDESDAETDETDLAMADKAYELLHRGVMPGSPSTEVHWSERNRDHGGVGKLSCWRDLAFIIRWSTSPEKSDDKVFNKDQEEIVLLRIQRGFREWEQSFRMTREQSALQREWSKWLEALEILWWLGYRREAFELASEVRSFSSDKDSRERFMSIQRWNPATEHPNYFEGDDFYVVENWDVPVGYIGNYPNDPDVLQIPVPPRLFGRDENK